LSVFGVQTVRDLYEELALVRFLLQTESAKFLLLGIRCSNFQDDDDRSGSNQMNIEKFLESKPSAVQSPPPRHTINSASMSLLPGREDLDSQSPTAATTTTTTTRPAKKQPRDSKTASTLAPALSTAVNSSTKSISFYLSPRPSYTQERVLTRRSIGSVLYSSFDQTRAFAVGL
jgi:hypothetical protein